MNTIPLAICQIQNPTYNDLLQSKEWAKKREEILLRDGHKCVNCGSKLNLQVHHRQYHLLRESKKFIKPWEYKTMYLITLCLNCHKIGHNYYKVPVFTV